MLAFTDWNIRAVEIDFGCLATAGIQTMLDLLQNVIC